MKMLSIDKCYIIKVITYLQKVFKIATFNEGNWYGINDSKRIQ